MRTEVVRASELRANVFDRILVLRQPDVLLEYRKELAKYKRRLGKRAESSFRRSSSMFGEEVRGFKVTHMGQEVFIERPQLKKPTPYGYSSYDRSFGFTDHARIHGLLSSPRYNRNIRPQRVDEYMAEMRAGRWHDLLSDPVAITDAGDVVNGQHRLAAASLVDWSDVENDPCFLVLWGVDPHEALYADGSRRTHKDESTIAARVSAA